MTLPTVQLIRRLALGCALLLIVGCTTQTGPEIRVDEAVSSRVAAGMQYLQQGEPSEARRHLSRALDLNDRSAMAHNAMALLYNYEDDPEREEHHYRRALRADRNYAPALNNYATLLYSRGEYRRALEMFTRAANDPSYEGRGSAWFNIGRCHLRLDDAEQAHHAFTRSIRLNPGASQPNLELAALDFAAGRTSRSWGYFQQYTQRGGVQTPRSLWLGIRIADALDLQDQQSSFELALANRFSHSPEHRQWQDWKTAKEQH